MPRSTVERGERGARPVVRALAAAIVLGLGLHALSRAPLPDLRALRAGAERLLGGAPVPTPTPAGSPVEALHAAAARGRATEIRTLLSRIDAGDLDRPVRGMTALMRAASTGDAATVRALIAGGADPNARGAARRTALQYAAEKNRVDAARALLDAGADVDGVDNGSLSPLVMAADRDYTDLALLLLARGANPNIQNVDGWTALMDAAEAGNVRVVQALLAAGAQTVARHRNGWTALDFARDGGHDEVVRILARHGRPAPALRTGRPAATGDPSPAPQAALPDKKGARR